MTREIFKNGGHWMYLKMCRTSWASFYWALKTSYNKIKYFPSHFPIMISYRQGWQNIHAGTALLWRLVDIFFQNSWMNVGWGWKWIQHLKTDSKILESGKLLCEVFQNHLSLIGLLSFTGIENNWFFVGNSFLRCCTHISETTVYNIFYYFLFTSH